MDLCREMHPEPPEAPSPSRAIWRGLGIRRPEGDCQRDALAELRDRGTHLLVPLRTAAVRHDEHAEGRRGCGALRGVAGNRGLGERGPRSRGATGRQREGRGCGRERAYSRGRRHRGTPLDIQMRIILNQHGTAIVSRPRRVRQP